MDEAASEQSEPDVGAQSYRGGISSVAFAVFCLLLVIGAIVEATGFPGRAGLAPLTVAIPTAALLLLVVISEVRQFRYAPLHRPLVANPYLWTALYGMSFYVLGAVGALLVFSFTLIRFRERASWKASLIATGAAGAGFFIMTEILLSESLYRGVLLELLR